MDLSKDKCILVFILNIMPNIMFDPYEFSNVSFNFKEEEGKKFVLDIIKQNIEKDILIKQKLYDNLVNIDYSKPVIEVSNYKIFFDSIHKLFITYIKKLNKKNVNCFYEFVSMMNYIWLRMTPDDFKNVEDFLIRQRQMLNNSLLGIDNEKKHIKKLDDLEIYYQSRLAHHFDEGPKEIVFSVIYNEYEVSLPVIRYGIFEENNERVCEISSIQYVKQISEYDHNNELNRYLNRKKYKLNKEVSQDLINDVEPKKIMSLLLFIKLIKKRNINIIRVPSFYVLDYEFHEKRNKVIRDLFECEWTDYSKEKYPDKYIRALSEYIKVVDKQDEISFNKSSNFIHLFERLIYHLNDVEIIEYPNEVSSNFKFRINSLDKVNNDFAKKLIK